MIKQMLYTGQRDERGDYDDLSENRTVSQRV